MDFLQEDINLYNNEYLYLNKGEQPLRILLLEDLRSDAELIKLQLRKLNTEYEVKHCSNKESFFSEFEQFKPHVVLSDYNLPQFTGMEALKSVHDFNPYIPFIICTGSINEETAVACFKAGADDYVLKDSMGRLASAVENALASKSNLVTKNKVVAELSASEENFKALAENAPDNIYKLDREGIILYVNRSVDGVDRNHVLGTSIFDFVNEKNVPKLKAAIKKAFNTKKSSTVEIEGNPNDPESEWYLCRLGPVMIDGQVDSVVFIPGRITERVKAELETKHLNERLQDLTRHLENIRDEEKERIAIEIHDQLGQELTGNKLGLFWIKQQLLEEHGPADKEKVIEKIDYLVDLTTTTIQTVRRIALELRPVVLDNMGLLAALEWHVENYNENHDTLCSIDIDIYDLHFDKEFSTNIYRIVQEALTNINRHAQASSIQITFKEEGEELLLKIADDGVGIDMEKAKKSKSLGLFGMKERVRTWKGEFEMMGKENEGTTLSMRFKKSNVIATAPLIDES